MSWDEFFNIAELASGNYRSIAGYAAESLVIGRAMQCGYNLFFKAWRDSPYDGVLDYQGVLFRVEIKGTRADSFSVTSGGRSGAQIDREAENREHILRKEDVDFLLGVNNLNGDCYLIPSEVLQIFNMQQLQFSKLDLFKEKWGIPKTKTINGQEITTEKIKLGFYNDTDDAIAEWCDKLQICLPQGSICEWQWPGFRRRELTRKEYLILEIWKRLLS
jgi:hypothetical protein